MRSQVCTEVIVLYINTYNSESVECGVREERREVGERSRGWEKKNEKVND